MAYNRRNFLQHVLDIQTIVRAEKKHGRSQKWIFENIIKADYRMSRSTFNNYMCINAKRELALLNEKQQLLINNK